MCVSNRVKRCRSSRFCRRDLKVYNCIACLVSMTYHDIILSHTELPATLYRLIYSCTTNCIVMLTRTIASHCTYLVPNHCPDFVRLFCIHPVHLSQGSLYSNPNAPKTFFSACSMVSAFPSTSTTSPVLLSLTPEESNL